MVNYSNLLSDTLEEVRDILRNDSILKSLLGITNPENHIFVGRPIDQTSGFENPRIVLEDPFQLPSFFGENSEGFNNDEMTFLVTGWIDEDPWQNSYNVSSRINFFPKPLAIPAIDASS